MGKHSNVNDWGRLESAEFGVSFNTQTLLDSQKKTLLTF